MQYDQVTHNLLERTKTRTKRRLEFLTAFSFFLISYVRECYINNNNNNNKTIIIIIILL